jgi:DNA-binding CsgD family transcriptional regulator
MTMIETSSSPHPGPGVFRRAGRPHETGRLVGRDRDLAVIRAFLDELPARGEALLLSGEPGVGKSALLDAAEETAARAGIRVLRAAGAESEDMSFGVLNQLLLPLRADIDRLDDLSRSALKAALGFSDGPAYDRLVVSNATLTLLGQAAVDRPLLLIVDSLHWADQASGLVLGFVARRLRPSQVGLLAAERTRAGRVGGLDGPGHEVRPLDDEASARLVSARFPGIAPGVRQRIVTEARGNSLALLEWPATLSRPQRSALAPLPAILPLSGRLRSLLPARVSALPPAAAYLLLLAVLEGTGDLGLLRAAAAGQFEAEGLALAEQAGLVRIDAAGRRFAFPHPGIRSAVLELSGNSAVRRAQLALAAQLRDQPERRAWHLAEAAIELKDDVAPPAAPATRQAPDCDAADRARRLAAAAYHAASVTGDLSAAEALLADARRADPDAELSAETALATAFVLLHGDGDAVAAHRLVVQGMRAAPGEAAGPLVEQARWILVAVGRLTGREEHRETLKRLMSGSGSPQDAALSSQSGPAQVVRMASMSAFADRLADHRQALRRVARPEADGGAGPLALRAGILLAFEAYQAGEWDEAWRLAETAAERCAAGGYQLLRRQAQTVLAFVAAGRGDTGTAQALADEISRWAAPRELTSLLAGAHYASALTALGQSDFSAAYEQAARISPAGEIPARQPYAAWALLDLTEAALRTGRPGDADAHAEAARRAGLAATSPRLALLCAAATAMTAPDDEAPALFERALASEGAERWPFDRARVHLLFGERLRRLRAAGTARVHLAAALNEFRRLGAPAWAERAATALRATGQVTPGTGTRGHPDLTAHELEIARLAATGLSNREIGDRLFMSHRTVASHLYRMFPKLGIASRAAIGVALRQDHG